MGAPKGNQFWKLRSKHGRDKLFATPELLMEAAQEYFEWCDKTPILKHDVRGKVPEDVYLQLQRPYTMQGLCIYLNCHTTYFNQFKKNLAEKDDRESKGFYEIVTRIEQAVYQNKFEGASIGIFNSSIIARDLGLADKKEIDGNLDIGITVKDLTDEDIPNTDDSGN